MFCKKCENELQKGLKSVALIVIAALILSFALTGCGTKESTTSGTLEPAALIDAGTPADGEISELPELAPDSDEEYEAFFDKLEYLTLGDEAKEPSEEDADEAADETADKSEDTTGTDVSIAAGDNGAKIAKALSTTDYAKAMDFEWLHDVMESDGTGAGILLNASQADPIPTDDNSYLNGGWKAYMYGTDPDYGERYLNAEIEAQGETIRITLNWKYFYLDGTSYEESGSSTFNGQRDPADGVVTAGSSSGNLELAEFYISKDQGREYALGAFQWPSGELCFLGLMR